MADEAQTVRSINWREVFPFTNLFKAFRVAVHPSKLVLALTALLLIYFGGRILDGLWVDKHLVQPGEGHGTSVAAVQSAQVALDRMRDLAMDSAGRVRTAEELGLTGGEPSPLHRGKPRGIFITFFDFEVEQVNTVTQGVLAWEWGVVGAATCNFVVTGPAWLLTWHPLYFFLFGVWFLLTWSIFGGAISRIAAVHVARDEKISVRQAVRFSLNKLLSFIFAPLIPVLILLVIGVVIAACGWVLFHIPILGPIVAAVLFFLALIAGLVMTLVLLGLAGGFNLMYPTVAVEGSDSFDAISRSFSYVFARPWRMLFYTAVAIVYGALTYLFVRFFIWLLLALTHFFVSWWLTDKGQPGQYFPYIWPGPRGSFMNMLVYSPGYEHLKWSEDAAAGIISFWVYLVIGLLGAYAISFYFSANTIIYYLMRREVDATELEDVYVEESEDEFADTAGAGAAGGGGGGGTPAATNIVTTTVSSTTVATVSEPADSIPAPSTGSTSAPSGGVTGAAGSADPGGGAPSQSYTEPSSDAPTSSDEPPPQP
jgi:hypothetical protein